MYVCTSCIRTDLMELERRHAPRQWPGGGNGSAASLGTGVHAQQGRGEGACCAKTRAWVMVPSGNWLVEMSRPFSLVFLFVKMTGVGSGPDDDQAFRQPAKSDLLDLEGARSGGLTAQTGTTKPKEPAPSEWKCGSHRVNGALQALRIHPTSAKGVSSRMTLTWQPWHDYR